MQSHTEITVKENAHPLNLEAEIERINCEIRGAMMFDSVERSRYIGTQSLRDISASLIKLIPQLDTLEKFKDIKSFMSMSVWGIRNYVSHCTDYELLSRYLQLVLLVYSKDDIDSPVFTQKILPVLQRTAELKGLLAGLADEHLTLAFMINYLNMSFSVSGVPDTFFKNISTEIALSCVDKASKYLQVKPNQDITIFIIDNHRQYVFYLNDYQKVNPQLKEKFFAQYLLLLHQFMTKGLGKDQLASYAGKAHHIENYPDDHILSESTNPNCRMHYKILLYSHNVLAVLKDKEYQYLDRYLESIQSVAFHTLGSDVSLRIFAYDTTLPSKILNAALERHANEWRILENEALYYKLSDHKSEGIGGYKRYDHVEHAKKTATIALRWYRLSHKNLEINQQKTVLKAVRDNIISAINRFLGPALLTNVFRSLFYRQIKALAVEGLGVTPDRLDNIIMDSMQKAEAMKHQFKEMLQQMDCSQVTVKINKLLDREKENLIAHLSCIYAEKYGGEFDQAFINLFSVKLRELLNNKLQEKNPSQSISLFRCPWQIGLAKTAKISHIVSDLRLSLSTVAGAGIKDITKTVTIAQHELEAAMENAKNFHFTASP
jgi:hypothetical protein